MHWLRYLKFNGDKDSSVHQSIITSVNCRMSPCTDSNNFQSDAKAWSKLYLTVYQTKTVTPYMHSLAMHVCEFIDLKAFSQQGLQKLNDLTTLHYMRSTNHQHTDEAALRQLILERNRLETLEDEGVKRLKTLEKQATTEEVLMSSDTVNKNL